MTRLGSTTAAATVLVAAAVFFLPASDALGVLDSTPPTGAVAGVRSPAAGTLGLLLYATDTGLGLAGAEASLDERTPTFVRLGGASCPEHPSDCPKTVSAIPLSVDTRPEPDGPHQLRVRVTDAAGNTATLVDRAIVVRNAATVTGGIATVRLGITAGRSGGGGVPGSASRRRRRSAPCRSPQLKMRLARKPLWRTRPGRLPVLRFGLRHPYRGRLTCRLSGRRVSAPNGTAVQVIYRIWRRTTFKRRKGPVRRVRKGAIGVRGGRLGVRLGFPTGRTIIFRYRSPNGELARAKLRIAVARPDPPRRRR